MAAAGCWLLAAGCWLLTAGCYHCGWGHSSCSSCCRCCGCCWPHMRGNLCACHTHLGVDATLDALCVAVSATGACKAIQNKIQYELQIWYYTMPPTQSRVTNSCPALAHGLEEWLISSKSVAVGRYASLIGFGGFWPLQLL